MQMDNLNLPGLLMKRTLHSRHKAASLMCCSNSTEKLVFSTYSTRPFFPLDFESNIFFADDKVVFGKHFPIWTNKILPSILMANVEWGLSGMTI